MISALGTIDIYKPTYYTREVNGVTQIVRSRYQNTDDGTYNFPVTDACERSATVMADDYVKLSFKLLHRVVFDAFAYIWYDEQLYFLKEDYRPTSKGSHYEYTMKFVSVGNMLDKSLCMRYINVPGQTIDPEPEINMNGTLDDMAAIVMGAINGAAVRLAATRPVGALPLFYVYILQNLTLGKDTKQNTPLKTFSFSGQNISDVLTTLANDYEIEWWVSHESIYASTLHLCRCEVGDTIPVSDEYKSTDESRGLKQPAEYSQEWSNVPQVLIPFGSDRNMNRKQALEDVNGNSMYVSYGKQLRLAPNTDYTVQDREGVSHTVRTNALGAFVSAAVKSGIETTKQFDDIYPRCHFRVMHVQKEGTEHPIYTITAAALKADGTAMSYAEMVAAELLPLQIEPNETLSVVFESGYLNGREFEVRHDIKEVNNVMVWTLTIVPEEGGDDGVSLPFGNFIPHGSDEPNFDGDTFAIFHMVMPAGYVTQAQAELAQAAYDEMLAIEDTRPEIKCNTEQNYFANRRIRLGQRVAVYSELFGELTYDSSDFGISSQSAGLFVSRVTSFQHSLTKPCDIEFKLASACVEGRMASIEAVIADRTSDIRGLEQRSLNLSRRGWHDADEMEKMLQTVLAQMMLVGTAKNQFSFTMAIESVGNNVVSDVEHFGRLHVSAGYIQHTQEPYIKYSNGGKWEVDAADITTDINNNSILYDPAHTEASDTPYYLYAHCVNNATKAQLYLTTEGKESEAGDNGDYLLLGILSSEFLDEVAKPKTSLRVFNRSNGYTQIAGGTITTEQIQDPTRSLIIDFQSNPPRIIAKRGAEIIGNIRFKASDSMTAEEQLEALGLGVNEAKGAADAANSAASSALSAAADAKQAADNAQTAVNNVTDDGIISGGTEKANLKREWQAIAGANLLGNTDGSYFKALSQATKYSVIDKYLNGFFGALKYAMEYILKYPNADTPISAGIPTSASSSIKTREDFNLLWKNYYDEEIAVLNAVSDKIKSAADAAQATADGLKWTNILKDKNIVHKDGGQKSGFVYTLIYSSLNKGTYIATRTQETVEEEQGGGSITGCLVAFRSGIKPTSDFSNSNGGLYDIYKWGDTFTVYTPIDLYACMQSYDILYEDYGHGGDFSNTGFIQPPFTWSIKGINLVTHTQDANTALDYLRAALTGGSTEIAGGLTMTNVLMLKNLQGVVTAGMSGLTKLPSDSSKSENVLMWGGGTYEDAYNAAESADYYKKDSATPITTLLKKDGTGKIGIFKISDTQAVVDVPNQGKVLIDASTTNGGIFIRNNKGENKISIKNGVLGSDIIPQEKSDSGSKSFSFSNVLCSGSSGTCTTQTSAYLWTNMLDTYSGGTNTIKVTFENVSFRQMLRYSGSTPTGNTTAKIILRVRSGSVVSQVASKTLTLQNVTSGSNYVAELTYQNFSLSYTTNSICTFELYVELTGKDHIACLGDFKMNGTVKWSWSWKPTAIPQTVIGTDGFATVYDSGHYFMVRNNSNGQQIFAKGLSTTKGTSGSGELYVSSSFIEAFKSFLDYMKIWVEDVRSVGSNAEKAEKMKGWCDTVKTNLNDSSLISNS